MSLTALQVAAQIAPPNRALDSNINEVYSRFYQSEVEALGRELDGSEKEVLGRVYQVGFDSQDRLPMEIIPSIYSIALIGDSNGVISPRGLVSSDRSTQTAFISPTVVSVAPANMSREIDPRTTEIRIVFNRPMGNSLN